MSKPKAKREFKRLDPRDMDVLNRRADELRRLGMGIRTLDEVHLMDPLDSAV